MCIIVAKPAGVTAPSLRTLRTCWANNPDGAGLMYADGKTVRIRKGFMTWDDFEHAYNALGDMTEHSLVMHFRIATHGGVNPACTHPFPVTHDGAQLRALETSSRLAVAHNGVIQCAKPAKTESDTMAYIRDVVAPLRRLHEDVVHDDNALDVLRATVGSKLCLLDNSGDMATIGEFDEVGGVLYSNGSYASTYTAWNSYGNVWDREEWYDVDEGEAADELETLKSWLPWEACESCPEAEECALSYPVCASEAEARGGYLIDEEVTAWNG